VGIVCNERDRGFKVETQNRKFVNPWASVARSSAPFLVEMDKGALAAYSVTTRGQKPEFALNTSVVPEPWCGPVLNSRVLVLSGNPHWDDRDNSLPQIARDAMWQNLSGELPLFWLSPELEGTTGASWYRERLLKEVLKDCSAESVATGLSLIDFIGYRSHRWDQSLRVPSQDFTAGVVAGAIGRGAVIVVSRGWKLWSGLVPELKTYPRLYRNSSPQNVRLSRRNTSSEGFEAILEALT
jgi:hypothetical protein